MFKKFGAVALSTGLVFSGIGLSSVDAAKPDHSGKGKGKLENGKVENVIYMIPDGFSSNYAANYRAYKGNDAVWDEHLKGMFTTNSANSDITDSAAAGTAMATGQKTNNGVIGLDPEGNKLKTILEASEEKGKSSGLVATSTITHATPASFATHVSDRNNETEIARQLIDSDVDVILGGGKNNFLPKSQNGNQEELNLIKKAKDKNFEFVETRDQLLNSEVEKGEKLLGLFAGGALSPELHRGETDEPSLAEMTDQAIDVLEEDKDGFFLVVEGSQIDWAGHANDAAWAMSDVEAFEAAVQEAIQFAEQDGKTLVVVAGDHDTGGITTGANDFLEVNADLLHNVTATGDYMAAQLNKERSNVNEIVETYTGLTLSDEEIETIKVADDAALAINTVVSNHALVGWTSTNHTGADIPVYAFGPQSNNFVGFHDNTDLPKLIADALKLK
ncbi:alkaline phosphatase [Salinibacillus xinjiangensis]|uniref:Alkaline phosphatase n=1 Tax=Salinibacillus xinjiangensis TaxID=1229268 RepID=A0A6G1X2I3_9BACI|nr:alkaline phosphatase [Salinibacillus xinjiangensis]MRG85106.1 alkaline phosphatase [Salinibacillus xinjiangensis]